MLLKAADDRLLRTLSASSFSLGGTSHITSCHIASWGFVSSKILLFLLGLLFFSHFPYSSHEYPPHPTRPSTGDFHFKEPPGPLRRTHCYIPLSGRAWCCHSERTPRDLAQELTTESLCGPGGGPACTQHTSMYVFGCIHVPMCTYVTASQKWVPGMWLWVTHTKSCTDDSAICPQVEWVMATLLWLQNFFVHGVKIQSFQ